MAVKGLLRGAAAAIAAGLGLLLATSSGAPFLAGLLAMLAGVIPLGPLVAPRRSASAEEQPAEKAAGRSEEERGGKECGSTVRSLWSPTHYKKKQYDTTKQ